MKTRKIPLRMCSVTRERFPKNELLRIVRTPEDVVKVDLTGKLNGHGAYIKKDINVLEKAKKSKVLDKMLEITINEEVYLELENIINNNE